MRKRPKLFVNLLLILGIAAIGLVAWRALASKTTAAATSLRTATVATGTVTETVSASGTVQSPATVGASFAGTGTVASIPVKVGQRVRKGQVLATLDRSGAKLQLASAGASLAAANANLASVEATTGVTTAQLTQAEASVQSAKVAVQQARSALADTLLRSPIRGTVVAIAGAVGQASTASVSVSTSNSSTTTGSGSSVSGFVVVSDLARLEVRAYFSETDAAKLQVGQTAAVTLDATPNSPLQGKVASIDIVSTVVNNVVDYGVTISLDQHPSTLRVGQTANVSVTTAQAQNALYVPSAAIQTAGGSTTVIVMTGSRQVTTPVQTGLEGDQTTQILSGLRVGQRVVIPSSTGTNGFPGGGFPGGGVFRGGGGGGVVSP